MSRRPKSFSSDEESVVEREIGGEGREGLGRKGAEVEEEWSASFALRGNARFPARDAFDRRRRVFTAPLRNFITQLNILNLYDSYGIETETIRGHSREPETNYIKLELSELYTRDRTERGRVSSHVRVDHDCTRVGVCSMTVSSRYVQHPRWH